MTPDFDRVPDRRGTDSLKWNVDENELPLWVADMDFPAAEPIRAALQKRIDHGVFGYTEVPAAWYDAYTDWWKTRHGFAMDPDGLIFCTGAIPAISSMVRKLTTPAEKVVLQTPVYNIFFNSVLNNGRVPLESPLAYKDGAYDMDLADLERKMADPQTTLMILCNPHNPVGKIWPRPTLAEVGRLAKQYGVTVISDELHCDLTAPGHSYVPFASASDDCRSVSVTCLAPTKAFNLAGIQTAAVYVHDPFLRHKVWRGLNTDEVAEPNGFACDAAVAAFTEGAEWLDALREYLFANRAFAEDFIAENIPVIRAVKADATYLLWLDCRAVTSDDEALQSRLRESAGVRLSPGSEYGKGGEGFLRLNLACTRATLAEALERLAKAVGA